MSCVRTIPSDAPVINAHDLVSDEVFVSAFFDVFGALVSTRYVLNWPGRSEYMYIKPSSLYKITTAVIAPITSNDDSTSGFSPIDCNESILLSKMLCENCLALNAY